MYYCGNCSLKLKRGKMLKEFDIERAKKLYQNYQLKSIVWLPDYPEKMWWRKMPDYKLEEFENGLRDFYAEPTSLLYTHFPFCPSQCDFCNCKTKIINSYLPVHSYLKSLHQEIKLHLDFCQRNGLKANIT